MAFTADSPVWILLQQAFLRLGTAGKFFLVAYIIGPEAIGVATIAMTIAAYADALTDFGIGQAAIRREDAPDPNTLGAIWTIGIARSLVLSTTIYLLSQQIARACGIAESSFAIDIAATSLLLKSLQNPTYQIYSRMLDFRKIAAVETIASAIDIAIAVSAAAMGIGPLSLVLGSLSFEMARLILSWFVVDRRVLPNFRWHQISDLISYGKDIWLTNIIISTVNQVDKIIVAKFLGGNALGSYQTSVKIAQLATIDIAGALSTYIYPKITYLINNSEDHRFYFKKYIAKVAGAAILGTILAVTLGPAFTKIFLGEKWNINMEDIFFACLPGVAGAILVNQAAYVKSLGLIRHVIPAIVLQLSVSMGAAYYFIGFLGQRGMMLSNAMGGLSAIVYIFFVVRNKQFRRMH